MSQLRVVMTGDEAKLFQAIQNVVKQTEKAESSFRKSEKTASESEKAAIRAAKEQAKSAREGARLADSLKKKSETLNDTFHRQRAAIEAAGAAGLKSQEEVKQAVERLKVSVRQQAAAAKEAERAKMEALENSTEAYQDQQKQISKGVDKVGELLSTQNATLKTEYEDLKKSIDAAFSAGKISEDEQKEALLALKDEFKELKDAGEQAFNEERLSRYGKALGGVAAVLTTAATRLETIRRLQAEALQNAEEAAPADVRLASVTGDKLPEAINRARQAALKFGTPLEQSKQLLFDAMSNDFEEGFEDVLKGSVVLGSQEAAGIAAGKVRQQFPSLTPEESIDLVLKASQQSNLDPAQLARSSPTAAQAGRNIGASPEQTFAIQSQLAALKKSGDEAATSLRAFSRVAVKGGLGGDGFFAAIDRLDALPAADREKLIGGNQEALEGLKDIRFLRGQIEAVEAELEEAVRLSGTAESPTNRGLRSLSLSPAVVAAQERQRTITKSKIRKADLAIEAANIDANRQILKDNRAPELITVAPVLAVGNSIPVVQDILPDSTAEAAHSVGEFVGGSRGSNFAINVMRMFGLIDTGPEPVLPQQGQAEPLPQQTDEEAAARTIARERLGLPDRALWPFEKEALDRESVQLLRDIKKESKTQPVEINVQ